MKKLLLFCLLTFLFSSCGVFKRVFSSTEKRKSKSEIENSVVKDNSVVKTDKTVIEETEQADTTKTTPNINISTTKKTDLSALVDGLTVLDTGLVTIKQKYDTISKTLKTEINLKPQKVDFKINKKKTTYTNKTEKTEQKEKQNTKAVISEEIKNKVKEKKPDRLPAIIAVVVLVALLVGGIAFWLIKRLKRLKNKSPL